MDYDGPPIFEPDPPTPKPDHISKAIRVFTIHMLSLIIVCVLIGIFWDVTAMWVIGGFTSLFMVGWHGVNVDRAIEKTRNRE